MQKNTVLTNGLPVTEDQLELNPVTGQQKAYVVLTEEERSKGWVRPYRDSYVHVGKKPKYELTDLTEQEEKDYGKYGYYKYEKYPDDHPTGQSGKFWTKTELERKGCGALTVMSRAISETYAKDPHFYGSTFCVGCRTHLPLDEFVWDKDGERVGS